MDKPVRLGLSFLGMPIAVLAEELPWVPEDDFRARLALVRNRMGWNVKDAGELTGVGDVNWRNWEHGKHPRNLEEVCRKIAAATGCSYQWLMLGNSFNSSEEFRNRCGATGELRIIPGGRSSHTKPGQMIPMALPLFTHLADN